MIKIAVASSDHGGLNDIVSQDFGRCPAFTIVDVEDGKITNFKIVQNPGMTASSGAGIQAAQTLIDLGCSVTIAGNIGPNAVQVLASANIDVRESPRYTVEQAIMDHLAGKLAPSSGAGRHGFGRGQGHHRF
ncbi:MAG: NifB/NifX family molybdenum-iron cluster-binding protein [Thermoplasmata archaeon]